MKTTINMENPPVLPIQLGITGENDYREIEFDVSSWKSKYPNGVISVIYKRPDGETYPVVTTESNGLIIWKISDTDVAAAGAGAVELRITSGGVIGKSLTLTTKTLAGLGNGNTPPSAPAQEWVQGVLAAAAAAAEDAAAAESSKDVAVAAVGKVSYVGQNGHWYQWDSATDTFADTNVPATGDKGDSGNYPLISNATDTTAVLEMLANTEYVYSAGLTSLTLTFGRSASDYSTEYRILFLAGASAPTVTLPASVAWAPCTPVFEAAKWYELSFVPIGTSVMGVWTAV